MEDPLNNPQEPPHDEPLETLPEGDRPSTRQEVEAPGENWALPQNPVVAAPRERISPALGVSGEYAHDLSLRRRSLRHNLFLLLGLTLAAFALTTWIFVRAEQPFGMFNSGAREVVRAQLRALDRGELRSAYGMFSAQYRQQVSFDEWNQLILTHWRMFHAEVVGAGEPAQSGPRVLLEIHLRGEDKKRYRARFTLIQLQGRWWVDDLHWSREEDERNLRT